MIVRGRVWALLVALSLLVAACGGGAEAPEEAPPAESPATEAPAATAEDMTAEETAPAEEMTAEETTPADQAAGDSNYPEQTTQWIVPFAAGGGADASFRAWQQYAEPMADSSISVQNVEGAGGVTGWTQFVNAEPDGYTLTLATPPFNIIPKVLTPSSTPYELDQFQYMCVFANSPNAIYVRADDERFDSLEDVISFAEENPGTLTAGMTGAAGTDIIHMYQLQEAAGIEFTPVPFDSGADAAQALAAGSVDVKFSDTSWIELQAGQLQALAVSSEETHPSWPDLPTYTELGYDVIGGRLRAPAAPPGTPDNVISYWEDICEQTTQDEAFVQDMADIGQPVQFMNAQEAREFIDRMEQDIRDVAEAQDLIQE